MNCKNEDFTIISMKKLNAEFLKTRNDYFVESAINSRRCVSEHQLNLFYNVRPKFEKINFTNKCFKGGFAMKILNNAFNYIRCDLLSKWERKYKSCKT